MKYRKRNIAHHAALISLAVALVILLLFGFVASSSSETLYVTVTELNGRAEPSKRSSVEALFYKDDSLEPTGNIHDNWVEVYGGETGTVWCSADYLSEIKDPSKYTNTSGGRVRLRKTPEGKSVGWVQTNEQITVSRIVNGWGYVKNKGWVDLQYFYQTL